MKKINLKGIAEVLSEKELKNVMGGSGWDSSCALQSSTHCSGGCVKIGGDRGTCSNTGGSICHCA